MEAASVYGQEAHIEFDCVQQCSLNFCKLAWSESLAWEEYPKHNIFYVHIISFCIVRCEESNPNFLWLLITLPLVFPQYSHHPTILNSTIIQEVAANTDVNQMWQYDLLPILIERYPESPGSWAVRQVRLYSLKMQSIKAELPGINLPTDWGGCHYPQGSFPPAQEAFPQLKRLFLLCSSFKGTDPQKIAHMTTYYN